MQSKHDQVTEVTNALCALVHYKDVKYNSSIIKPIHIFSKSSAEENILSRIDEKLARFKESDEIRKNDTADLMGYLVWLCVERGWVDFSEFYD